MIDNPEKLALAILGGKQYSNSSGQAHPYELIMRRVIELEAQLAEARELLEKADDLLDSIDTLGPLAEWATKEWHKGRDEVITAIAKLRRVNGERTDCMVTRRR